MSKSYEFPPRLMPAPVAARYIGVSESTLIKLGLPRKELRGKRMFDKVDLDNYADNLPYEGERGANSCDSVFGLLATD